MMPSQPVTNPDTDKTALDFSLVLGGPLYQLLRKARLSGSALELLHRRLIFFPLICWVPLLILSALEGRVSGGVSVPFLQDFETHIRFLVALPLLLVAEIVVFRRTRTFIAQFIRRNLISDADLPRFEAAITSATRLRNSTTGEIVLLLVVYTIGVLVIWRQFVALDTDTWYSYSLNGDGHLSLAGLWLAFVSIPVFQFFVLRWYYRIAIWTRFLWQVSRIPLKLVPTHADRAGGIGFVAGSSYAFAPFLMAHGALLSGMLADRIFHEGAALIDFKFEILTIIALLLCVVYGPLLAFSGQLWDAREKGKREYGAVMHDYVRAFDQKWLRGAATPDEHLLGNSDVQSLADLANGYGLVNNMQTTLISREGIIYFAAVTLVPILPLLLTMMPLDDLLKRLAGIFF